MKAGDDDLGSHIYKEVEGEGRNRGEKGLRNRTWGKKEKIEKSNLNNKKKNSK
jgi:hypothetical protein